jgi:hypothetical protein
LLVSDVHDAVLLELEVFIVVGMASSVILNIRMLTFRAVVHTQYHVHIAVNGLDSSAGRHSVGGGLASRVSHHLRLGLKLR